MADPSKVFVVHGRNSAARRAMVEFLRSIHLQPIEWTQAVEATGETLPYVGDVVAKGFELAQAVVVLMTPDDEAQLRSVFREPADLPYESKLTGQPRQNVILEAGMALGIDARRTVLVEIGELRPISDLHGRHTVRMDGTIAKRQDLAQRLKVAGCPVQLNGTDWHDAGAFRRLLARGRNSG